MPYDSDHVRSVVVGRPPDSGEASVSLPSVETEGRDDACTHMVGHRIDCPFSDHRSKLHLECLGALARRTNGQVPTNSLSLRRREFAVEKVGQTTSYVETCRLNRARRHRVGSERRQRTAGGEAVDTDEWVGAGRERVGVERAATRSCRRCRKRVGRCKDIRFGRPVLG